jgi:hypothetical protein
MFAKQREWWQLPNTVKMLVGGYGSGKTKTLCKRAIASALHNAPVPVTLVSPTFPMGRRTVLPTMEELLEGKSTIRRDLTWAHQKGEHAYVIKLECRPPATVMYLSGDNPDSLKGSNLASAYIDEPFIMDIKVYEQMHARCRHPSAKLIEIGLTGTPEELNWGYDLAEGELGRTTDVGVVRATTMDNKALPEDYYKRLLQTYDSKTADAYVRGMFVNLAKGQVYYGFDRSRNVQDLDAKPFPGAHYFIGMDFNVNPMAFCKGWRSDDHCHISHEWEVPNSDTQYAAGVLRDHLPPTRLVYPDPSCRQRHTNAPGGETDFLALQRAGFTVLAPIHAWPRRDSLNAVNKKLQEGTLTISPRCTRLVKYLLELTHERWNQQQSMTHLTDALRYPITYMFPVVRPNVGMSKLIGP